MIGCIGDLLAFIIFAGICALIGYIVKIVTGIEILFWVTSIGLFIFGFIGNLIGGVLNILGGFFRGDDD